MNRLKAARLVALPLLGIAIVLTFATSHWEPLVAAGVALGIIVGVTLDLRLLEAGARLRDSLERLERSGVDVTELRRELRGLPHFQGHP